MLTEVEKPQFERKVVCNKCGKIAPVTDHFAKPLKCECGGFYVTKYVMKNHGHGSE